MIAELFYPKELKEVIKDLREKDDLNEEAIKTLNWTVNYIYFSLFLISTIDIYLEYINPKKGIGIPIFGSLSMLFVSWLQVRAIWHTYMASYFFGKIKKGKIIGGRIREMGSVIFKVENTEDNVHEKIYAINPMKFSHPSYMPKKGDQIEYYYSHNSRYSAVPNISGYMKKCCLKKSMIEGVKI